MHNLKQFSAFESKCFIIREVKTQEGLQALLLDSPLFMPDSPPQPPQWRLCWSTQLGQTVGTACQEQFFSPGGHDGWDPCSTGLQGVRRVLLTLLLSDSDNKESSCNTGDLGSIPGSGRSSGEGNGNPLQYSCLENPMMDRGAWWATVHGPQRERHDWATDTFTFFAFRCHFHYRTLIYFLLCLPSPKTPSLFSLFPFFFLNNFVISVGNLGEFAKL